MKVLAFDACLGAVSVAVRMPRADGGWHVHDRFEAMTVGHAERLVPMIQQVMQAAGLDFDQLDRIAVTLGPGSFTGVRVGVAAARALSLATNVPVVGTTSLRVMAAQADTLLLQQRRALLAVAVDARRDAIYLQLFGADANDELSQAEVLSPQEAARRLAGRDAIAVSSAAGMMATAAAVLRAGHVEACLADLQPHAAALAALAEDLPILDPVTPLYLRASDAKPPAHAGIPRAD